MNFPNRKLGLIENLFDILHDVGGMIDVNVARIEGAIKPAILQQALDCLQKVHPLLQSHIVNLEDGAYFQWEGTTKIPLYVIDKQDENQWLKVAEEELHQKFPRNTSPLCRVTLLRSSINNGINEIIMTFHHAIVDGMSCMLFVDQLLFYYQQMTAGENIPKVVTMQLLPPLEKLLNSSLISKNNVAEKQHDEVISTPQLIIEEEAPPSDRHTCLVTRIVSQDMTLRLSDRCKQEKTTVHGALCAAMLLAAAKIAFTDLPLSLSCGSNVNLRKYCKPEVSTGHIACFASIVEEIHTLQSNTKFWNLARECKLKISHAISIGNPIARILSDDLKNVNRDIILKMSNHQMGQKNTIHISNLGKFNLADKYGELKLKELYFATGQHLIGSSFWLGVVTIHEQLFCTFAHVVPLVSTKTAKLLADSVIANIEEAYIC
ncbi:MULTISPECIES: condensation domain-containing protein [unclassified Nostoc]|uniref:condensation domain-containing protein n=1 Tax=unclassified Nostoc TaxID=2593658 RepID=UPI002AD3F0C5|nr:MULTISPECIES: condensation domain-containing protein [unclassified Nostoc]MDZ8125078.1 condensation domain-containing protein [Nostoc sp. CmiVER01]MDZ8226395.1 condensation domain-containing protein [Nostoc sp. ChiVER01]